MRNDLSRIKNLAQGKKDTKLKNCWVNSVFGCLLLKSANTIA